MEFGRLELNIFAVSFGKLPSQPMFRAWYSVLSQGLPKEALLYATKSALISCLTTLEADDVDVRGSEGRVREARSHGHRRAVGSLAVNEIT